MSAALARAQAICAKAVRDLKKIEAEIGAECPTAFQLRMMSALLGRYARECAAPAGKAGDPSPAIH